MIFLTPRQMKLIINILAFILNSHFNTVRCRHELLVDSQLELGHIKSLQEFQQRQISC